MIVANLIPKIALLKIISLKIILFVSFVVLSGWTFADNTNSTSNTNNSSLSQPNSPISINIGQTSTQTSTPDVSSAIKILLVITVISLAPAILIMLTSFTRIIVVLSMLRHAFGMQQTPPNTVLISLALFLTLFTMMPIIKDVNVNALQPYLKGNINNQKAMDVGMKPIRNFMIKQTREQDLMLIINLAKAKKPASVDQISTTHLITAFMLSELKTAFQIGFIIFIPFILIDLIVASILMSMGMIMVPPMMLSLPVKVLMFVLIDGWALVVQSLMSSF